MLSIKQLYQVGHGPSSSHTMGPAKALQHIKNKYPKATNYVITLFNSLALTGKGHLTEEAIKQSIYPATAHFKQEINALKHPNHLVIECYEKDHLLEVSEVQSVGGGRIVFIGEESKEETIYQETSFKAIKTYCNKNQLSLYDYILKKEGADIVAFLKNIWKHMKDSVMRGIHHEGILPGPLKLKRKASILYEQINKNQNASLIENYSVSSYAFAVSEENASGGIIVTAPTCGACGVLPAVLFDLYQKNPKEETRILKALAVAGLFGNLIKYNASISGAVAGCQAEIGSACSMAAAAHATYEGLNIDQVEYAAEIAMEHHLGLTCDPINGYVQIPCIERNAVAALRAIDASRLAIVLSDSRKISFDTVIETMYHTGLDMNLSYKETSLGGLAKHYKEEEDANCW